MFCFAGNRWSLRRMGTGTSSSPDHGGDVGGTSNFGEVKKNIFFFYLVFNIKF